MSGKAGPEKNYTVGLLLDFYGELLTDRQKEMLELYYNDDLSLSEVAEECGITRQGVRDALVKAERELTAFESHLGLLEKHRRTAETLGYVLERLEQMAKEGIRTDDLSEKLRSLM